MNETQILIAVYSIASLVGGLILGYGYCQCTDVKRWRGHYHKSQESWKGALEKEHKSLTSMTAERDYYLDKLSKIHEQTKADFTWSYIKS